MEIKLNTTNELLARAVYKASNTPATSPVRDEAAFENLHALDRQMDTIPVVRPDVVARAQQLISTADYPPERTIRSIANLLAIQMENQSQESA